MAMTMTNRGLYNLLTAAWSGSTDLRMLVIKGASAAIYPTAAAIRTMNFVSDLLAVSGVSEAAVAGYSRPALNPTITEEPASANTVTITDTAPVLTTPAAGEKWIGVGYYVHVTNDADSPLIGVDQPTPTTLDTNAQNVTLPALLITLSGS